MHKKKVVYKIGFRTVKFNLTIYVSKIKNIFQLDAYLIYFIIFFNEYSRPAL